MARVSDLLAVARGELGYTESPAGSNKTKYGRWYGLDGQSWCMMFVQWCFAQAGAAALLPAKTASCGALMRAAKSAGCWVEGDYRVGDVVIYNFPGGARTDHTGIVTEVSAAGVSAIEGNTAVGNDANGGAVMERTRRYSVVLGAVRPKYEEADMTQQDFNTMMASWLQEQANRAPGDFSADARAWAEKSGVIQGNADGSLQYKSFCTREQMLVFLYRAIKTLEKEP